MARLYLTILAIFAMIYSAVALPAVKGRQLEGAVPIPISVNITIGPAEVTFPAPNATFPAPNATFPAPNGTDLNSIAVQASRTRRSLRSFPIALPVPYKA